MGTRLYPNTKDAHALETLAGVPAGTKARLDATLERHKMELQEVTIPGRYDVEFEQYCELKNDGHMGRLNAFLTYGWGRFTNPFPGMEPYSGGFTPEQVGTVLDFNGIDVDPALCGGLHYC